MREFPHHYAISAIARSDGDVAVGGEQLPRLLTAPPAEFGGPGDRWSPETLITAAVADCYVLTFRAIAKHARLQWTSLTCSATGTLDRVDKVAQFTAFSLRVALEIPEGTSEEQARTLLLRAEQTCLITNSLKARCAFEADVHVGEHVSAYEHVA